MNKWYYEKNGEPEGPFSLEEILPNIKGETLVWRDNSLEDWVEAKNHTLLGEFFNANLNVNTQSDENFLSAETILLKSNEKLTETNFELLKNIELERNQKETLKKFLNTKNNQIENLDKENEKIKSDLKNKLNLIIQEKSKAENEKATLEIELKSVKKEFVNSLKKSNELEQKVKELQTTANSNYETMFSDYINDMTGNGFEVIFQDNNNYTVELVKKDGKVLPKKPINILIYILLFFIFSGIYYGLLVVVWDVILMPKYDSYFDQYSEYRPAEWEFFLFNNYIWFLGLITLSLYVITIFTIKRRHNKKVAVTKDVKIIAKLIGGRIKENEITL